MTRQPWRCSTSTPRPATRQSPSVWSSVVVRRRLLCPGNQNRPEQGPGHARGGCHDPGQLCRDRVDRHHRPPPAPSRRGRIRSSPPRALRPPAAAIDDAGVIGKPPAADHLRLFQSPLPVLPEHVHRVQAAGCRPPNRRSRFWPEAASSPVHRHPPAGGLVLAPPDCSPGRTWLMRHGPTTAGLLGGFHLLAFGASHPGQTVGAWPAGLSSLRSRPPRPISIRSLGSLTPSESDTATSRSPKAASAQRIDSV